MHRFSAQEARPPLNFLYPFPILNGIIPPIPSDSYLYVEEALCEVRPKDPGQGPVPCGRGGAAPGACFCRSFGRGGLRGLSRPSSTPGAKPGLRSRPFGGRRPDASPSRTFQHRKGPVGLGPHSLDVTPGPAPPMFAQFSRNPASFISACVSTPCPCAGGHSRSPGS